ncbi:Arf-GAP with Rho-GAP domain, ANK repeat and PH domain-containing protein 3 [Chelonia mydas]|uniref:Arf-GAP with Rho-GAP domain, ANK repeat and PH domain-containing protein 3 n=1 Tax=Chelonia mydas TaxID=8469 RepID=M7BTE8_CHEMY|nr:Arf-GAP with Rho-GAP domain, ANK repeat and PH domain-containing protein 3 [Chelonia mydas]
MFSPCDADCDIADWLATIHLERYQETFKQHGYQVARDAVSLGNEDLQRIGITATGHRKRILSLVQQTQLLVQDKGRPMARDACAKPGTCTEPLDVPRVCQAGTENNGTSTANGAPVAAIDGLGNHQCSAGPSQNPSLEREPVPPVAKPVPKPRTFFQRPSRAVRPEQGLVPTPLARTSVPTRKPGCEGPSAAFVVHEGFVPGESSMDLGRSEFTLEQQAGSGERGLAGPQAPQPVGRESALEPTPAPRAGVAEVGLDDVEIQAGCGKSSSSIPGVSPCLGHGIQPADCSPASPGMSHSLCSFPRSAPTSPAASTQREPSPAPGPPSQPASAWGRMEMVSNIIYEGLEPPSQPAGCSGDEEPARNRPTPRPLDSATQQGTTPAEKPDSPRWPSLDLPPIPQRPAPQLQQSSDWQLTAFPAVSVPAEPAEEPISPYCEAVFGRGLPAWEQKSTGTPAVPGCEAVPEHFPELKRERPRTSSECSSEGTAEEHESRAQRINWILQNNTKDYAMVEAPQDEGSQFSLPSHLYPDEVLDDLTISPYASYTLLSERPPTVLSGWLDKLSPQGNYVFQRRFIRFDGKNLMYFHSEKEPYPKGVIPLSVIEMARATKENKFQVVTSHRIFVFRAENEAQRNEWCSTLQRKVAEQRLVSPQPRLASSTHCQKCGTLELKGHKSKLFAALSLANMWLYKSEQFFKMGIAICLIELHGATIREAKNRSFELISPLKIFSFVAESEREKREWMEALQDAIAEMLYDYEVAEKIWSNKANKFCADCRALSPDWASINLCVVICKQCAGQCISFLPFLPVGEGWAGQGDDGWVGPFMGQAGQHRSLGSSVSKVQSLKLDTSVWSNEIVQLFIMLGNERANRFWAACLPPSEALYPDASMEQRQVFITHKYRDGRYRRPHPRYPSQDDVLQALCAAVAGPGLLKTILHFFSATEAGMAADTGGCDGSQGTELWRTPESSWHGNHPGSPSAQEPSLEGVYNEITQPVVHSGYLYKAPALSKLSGTRKSRDELHRVWCSLEKSLLFYETDKCAESVGKVELADMVSLSVSRADELASPGPPDRFRFALELFLSGDKVQQLGADGPDTLQAWASAIGKWFTPLSCHCLLGYEFQRVGRLHYRSMLSPEQWLQGFFILQKAHLFFCPGEEGAAEDSINLRRLQELSVVPLTETPEKKEVLILVEMGRTFYLQGVSRMDFAAWCTDIQASAGGRGNALRDQQLSRSDIPILVDSCIAFITQYGLRHEGIYRKNGAKSRIKVLMEQFRRDARNVKLRISDNFIEDVTDVLKRFFRELEDPVFTSELHPQWKEASGTHLLAVPPPSPCSSCSLPWAPSHPDAPSPATNHMPGTDLGQPSAELRWTLAALIGHLYRVQKCADFNQMNTKNLSLLFAPSLFQTDGKGDEVKVMEDLIDNYVRIFNIDEDQVSQMDLENSLITTWRDVQHAATLDASSPFLSSLQADAESCWLSRTDVSLPVQHFAQALPTLCHLSPQLSQAGDLIIEVYLEQKLPDCCVTLKVSPTMTAEELTNQVLEMRNVSASLDIWLTFEALENGELERPLHPKEKVLEQALQWCKLPEPSTAYLLVRKVPIGEGSCLFTGAKRKSPKCGVLKCREEPPKLLGCKFQERYFVIQDHKLLLLKEKRVKQDPDLVLRGSPDTWWGFTLILDKQQLYLACTGQAELWDWTTSILKAQHDDLRPVIMRRRSSSDLTKQKFGTMPLIPLRGDNTDATMLSANQTLRRLHTRRTLSMFFPMKLHQDSVEEQQEEAADTEPVYEEVGDFPVLAPLGLDGGLLAELSQVPAVDRSKKPVLFPEQPAPPALHSAQPISPEQRGSGAHFTKSLSLERGLTLEPEKAPEWDRSPGLRATQTASLERNMELPRTLPAVGREQNWTRNQHAALLPLPLELSPSPEPLQDGARKRSAQLPSPMNEKLMQELSSIILKKNECQADGPEQQVT